MYVSQRYPGATIVYDGYQDGSTTKDMTHYSRTSRFGGTKIKFSENAVFNGKQEDFLCNKTNKDTFIKFLKNALQKSGFIVSQASEDTDVLIVQKALQLAQSS